MTAKRIGCLRIWQRARAQARAVHDSFGRISRAGGIYGLRHQIQWCAVSVMNNIAEGIERRTDEDFARFLNIAKGSNAEVCGIFIIAEDQNRLSAESAGAMCSHAESLDAGIEFLARHLRTD